MAIAIASASALPDDWLISFETSWPSRPTAKLIRTITASVKGLRRCGVLSSIRATIWRTQNAFAHDGPSLLARFLQFVADDDRKVLGVHGSIRADDAEHEADREIGPQH